MSEAGEPQTEAFSCRLSRKTEKEIDGLESLCLPKLVSTKAADSPPKPLTPCAVLGKSRMV